MLGLTRVAPRICSCSSTSEVSNGASGAPTGPRPGRAGDHRGRRAAPPPHPRSDQDLPTNWPAEGAGSVLSLSSMSRDVCPGCLATSQGAPGRTRTCDPLLRRQPLYPAELQGLAAGRLTSVLSRIRPQKAGTPLPSAASSRVSDVLGSYHGRKLASVVPSWARSLERRTGHPRLS